jgi:cathepsin A (carboxypeptidase C)
MMGVFFLTVCILLFFHSLVVSYTSDALADEVTSMPEMLESLKSKQFSGFLQISPDKFIHYYYFESERDPETDSVIFWTNGGPGKNF